MNRKLAIAGLVGAILTTLSAVVVAAIIQPATDVSDEMWSYPLTGAALVPVSILYAGFHLLVFLGMLAIMRAVSSRAGRIGAMVAAAGTLILFFAELASIPIKDQRLDDTAPQVIGGVFGLGVALTAIGLLVAGVAVTRSGEWTGWRRYVLLGAGIWSLVMIGLSVTSALSLGVAIYGLTLCVLFAAVITQQSSAATEPRLRARIDH
jgi:hypothetical protein